MIQIYKKKNTNFSKNGDSPIFPSSAVVNAELNGAWTLELEHPIDDRGIWKFIEEETVIKVPSFNGDQLFRVRKIEKSDSGIEAKAEPIFLDAKDDCFLTDVRPTGKNGQQALDIMCAANKKYTAESNITRATTAYYQYKNLISAINGDDSNSFINRWGGEILYNNYKVIINERVGGDYGVELLYGKNIKADGLTEEIDMSDVVTRIYPKAYNGYKMSKDGYVDSLLIGNYPTVKADAITFSDVKMREDAQEDDEKNGVIVCDTQAELDNALIQKCRDQFAAGIDKPKVSISADMILLQDTDQYKDYKVLESVSLGDTTHCKHSKLGIVTDIRVIALEYDCIQKRVTSVELGDFKSNYFDRVTSSTDRVESITNPDGSIMAEKVQGILNGIYTQLKLQSTVAQKVKGRAFTVEDLDPDSDLFGCMTWGTQGLQLATRRTADGKDWDWTTAVTARGILADAIIAGILTDKTGKNYWNLDTGEFRLSGEAFKVDDQTVEDYVNGKIDNATAQIRLLTLQLTNDMCSVATEADGTGGDYSECYTDVMLLIGTTDITNSDKAQYTINPSSGVDGSWDLTRKRYTVRGMSGDNGSVTITATYAGITVSKVFSISKVKAGVPGSNGDSLESIVEYYAVSSSNTIAPGQWYPNPPQMTEQNRYLWNYETFIYSDGRREDTKKRIIGVYGASGQDGNGISSITNYYLATSQQSGVTTSTYGWTTTPQTMTEQKKYLWNYETIIYTDKSVYTVPPHIIGAYGDKGLPGSSGSDGRTSYVHIKFSDIPNPQYSYQIKESPGKYIGIYVDFEELDSTSPSRYTWTQFMGDNGKDGEDGIGLPGEDGKTSYVHFAYANSADGRTGFSTTDSTNKLYIGQYVDYVQNDSTDPARYSWTRIKGENGTDGRIFFMQANATVIKQGADNKYNPGAARFEGKQRIGSGRTQSYYGRFKIEETSNGSTWTQKYLSRTDEYYCQYTLFTTDIKQIRCTMYKSGGTSEILDMQTVAVVRDIDNLTQEEVFNILTDNGRIQGIFMRDGMLYINGEYIKADSISADKLKSKSITADKLNVSDLYALAATIAGWKINRNYISSTKDNIRLYSDGRIQIGNVIVSSNSNAMTVKNGMHVYYSTDEFGDGSGEFKLVNIHTFSSGAHLILGSNGTSVLKLSSSSKRYKDHIGYMSTGEAEKILDIPVVWFKYKDGYLRSDDAFVGKPIPGFYAEDVEEHYPVAVQRNEDGSVEDWNYRTLIPAMLKMIQTMHSDIEQLKELLKKGEK
nr:MAG TPA: tail protein [Caudoviricetes sp.]